jgi:hypothetical protein
MKITFLTGSTPTGQVVLISLFGLNLSTHPGKKKGQKSTKTKNLFWNIGQFSSNVEKNAVTLASVELLFQGKNLC